MKIIVLFILACVSSVLSYAQERQQERPNILWITAEDMNPNLGCYGDPDAFTPNIDNFSSRGVRFTNCFSIHPACSPSRSSLVTGMYPTTIGTLSHRAEVVVSPELVKCFPTLLRESGYYTFNGIGPETSKLDYNFKQKDQPWDKENSPEVEWRNCPEGRPFFGQINISVTHQSRYGRDTDSWYRQNHGKPGYEWVVHDPETVHVQGYHPDIMAVRRIWAEYHDKVTWMDEIFGEIMKKLEDDGLAEETIVIFFGDNGCGIPGGKIWLWNEGVHVPLIIRFPKKWAHLAPASPGSVNTRLVSFIDFAPTMLALAGVDIPSYMQGGVILGPQKTEPPQYVFAARDYFDAMDYDPARMVRDNRFHYIRNFMTHIGWDAMDYSWDMAPDMLEQWRQSAESGKLKANTRQACFFTGSKSAEELYDIVNDPAQMNNLAGNPLYLSTLERMRKECEVWMVENNDLGLLSLYELYKRSERDSPLEMGADPIRNPIEQLLKAANLSSQRDPQNISEFSHLLKDKDCALRRWGAIGLLALGSKATIATTDLTNALKDPAPDVRLTAAEALFNLGLGKQAEPVLIKLLSHESLIIRYETLLTLCRIGPAAQACLPYLENVNTKCTQDNLVANTTNRRIEIARACLGGEDPHNIRLRRQKYLP